MSEENKPAEEVKLPIDFKEEYYKVKKEILGLEYMAALKLKVKIENVPLEVDNDETLIAIGQPKKVVEDHWRVSILNGSAAIYERIFPGKKDDFESKYLIVYFMKKDIMNAGINSMFLVHKELTQMAFDKAQALKDIDKGKIIMP